jgi:NADPH:quinone reductase-like Zn-dependent oxidoreductase
MMRAALCERYGGAETVRVAEIPRPVAGSGQVLVRILVSTLDSGDRRVRQLDLPPGFGLIARLAFGITRPRQPILGTALAGIVEAVGEGVTGFQPGDAVVASTGAAQGCHAGFRVIGAGKGIVAKPESLPFETAAAAIFGGMAAHYYMVERARVTAQDRVLIVGAGGAVGLAAVQLAKAAGAHVTACCSAGKAALMRQQGADAVIDYRQQDPLLAGGTYDVVFDTVGTRPVRDWFAVVPKGGRICPVAASLFDLLAAPLFNMTSGRRVLGGVAPDTAEALARVMALAGQGILRPVIGARYALSEIAQAHAAIDAGHKTGSIVITLQ